MNVAEQPDGTPFNDDGRATGGPAVLVKTSVITVPRCRENHEEASSTHLPPVFTPGLGREGRQLLCGQLLERSSIAIQSRLKPQSDFVELR
jgi:hypothetical protein